MQETSARINVQSNKPPVRTVESEAATASKGEGQGSSTKAQDELRPKRKRENTWQSWEQFVEEFNDAVTKDPVQEAALGALDDLVKQVKEKSLGKEGKRK